MASTVEHLRAFPKDALSMPGHDDEIIKMKATNMLWLKYDTLVRQKDAKRIARDSRKVKSWTSTDVVLYLACQPPTLLQKPKTFSQRPSMGPPTGQSHHQHQPVAQQSQGTQLQLPTQGGIQMQSGTCWRFQSTKGCDGTCLWPHTHQCYSCGRDNSTTLCPLGDTHPDPNSTQPLPPLLFPALEERVPECSKGAPDRDYRSATTGDDPRGGTLKEEWPTSRH